MDHIFKWNGQHLGFINNGYLFDSGSTYIGWVEQDGSVWKAHPPQVSNRS